MFSAKTMGSGFIQQVYNFFSISMKICGLYTKLCNNFKHTNNKNNNINIDPHVHTTTTALQTLGSLGLLHSHVYYHRPIFEHPHSSQRTSISSLHGDPHFPPHNRSTMAPSVSVLIFFTIFASSVVCIWSGHLCVHF